MIAKPEGIQTPSLVDLAKTISTSAVTLQNLLDQNNLPQPSLEATGRANYHDAFHLFDLLKVRSQLIDASQEILRLARGPVDCLVALVGSERTNITVLRTLDGLKVPQNVPLTGAISYADLAAKVGAPEDILARLLGHAYTMRMFYSPEPGFVAHTAISAAIPNFAPYIWLQLGNTAGSSALKLLDSLKEWKDGTPAVPTQLQDPKGRDLWQILDQDDPDKQGYDKFSAAMHTHFSSVMGDRYLGLVYGFDWAALGEGPLVDVGGADGHNSIAVAKAFPNLKVIVQDLEQNTIACNDNIAAEQALIGAKDRVSFQCQDFFAPQPEALAPKAYYLARIFHDWSDEDCIKIAKNFVPAMEKYGTKIFITDRVIPDRTGEGMPLWKESASRHIDILMHTFFGARERTVDNWDKLFKAVDPRLQIEAVRQPENSEFGMLEIGLKK